MKTLARNGESEALYLPNSAIFWRRASCCVTLVLVMGPRETFHLSAVTYLLSSYHGSPSARVVFT